MKIQKITSTIYTSLIMMILSFVTLNTFAQTKDKPAMAKEYCMMKGGKMMHMKDGKMMAMSSDMTMKNGTKCMTNGECIMMNGAKMKMKEGECMDMKGHMAKSLKELNAMTEIEDEKMESMTMYACPMHPEITSDKSGKCSKCGMELVKKN